LVEAKSQEVRRTAKGDAALHLVQKKQARPYDLGGRRTPLKRKDQGETRFKRGGKGTGSGLFREGLVPLGRGIRKKGKRPAGSGIKPSREKKNVG